MGNQQGNRADISLFDKPEGIVHTVVREAIQNSLDAKQGDGITVEFKVHQVPKGQIPDFDTLLEHFKAITKSKVDFSQNIKGILKESLDFIASNSSIEVLEISDFDTKGLGGVNFQGDLDKIEGKAEKAWTRLLFQTGIQEKGGLAGGSYGFGKLACFGMSRLNTVFYSTLNEAGQFGFIGKSIIPDHKFNGENKTSPGFWCSESSDEGLSPLGESRIDKVHEIFGRNRTGTSIFILCPKYEEGLNLPDLLAQAVLMNYYPALYSGLLRARIVTPNQVVKEISVNTLKDQKFLLDLEKNDFESFLRVACISQNFTERVLPLLGKCRFYIYECEPKSGGNLRRVECFRLNGQVVHSFNKRRPNLFKSFIAVFECLDKLGNRILASAENETHDSWGKEAFDRTRREFSDELGKNITFNQIKTAYDNFVNECLDEKYGSINSIEDGVVKNFSAGKGNSQLNRKEISLTTKQGSFAIFRGGPQGNKAEVPRVDVTAPGDSSGVPLNNDALRLLDSNENDTGNQNQGESSEENMNSSSPSGSDNVGMSDHIIDPSPQNGSSKPLDNGDGDDKASKRKSTVTKKSPKNNKKNKPDLSGKSGRKNSENMVKDEIRITPALVRSDEDSYTYKIVIKTKARGTIGLNFYAVYGSEEEVIEGIEFVKGEHTVHENPFRIKIDSDSTSFEIKTHSYYQLSVKGEQ